MSTRWVSMGRAAPSSRCVPCRKHRAGIDSWLGRVSTSASELAMLILAQSELALEAGLSVLARLGVDSKEGPWSSSTRMTSIHSVC